MKILRRKFFILSILIIWAILSSFFTACSSYHAFDGFYFNTYTYILVNGKDFSSQTKSKIENILIDLENSVSQTKQSSIKSLNNAQKNMPISVEQTLYSLTESAISLYNFTDKLFNPAVYPLLSLWKLSSDTFNDNNTLSIPNSQDILEQVNIAKKFGDIVLNDGKIIKSDDNLKLDLGGIAKGYAVDKIKDILISDGYKEGYISIGGSSIYVFNSKDDLLVNHPRNSGHILSISKDNIRNSSLSTSGDYIRYYLGENGRYYSHLINPNTGEPANTGFQSITIIGKTACECDAISTALCLMEKQEFITFVNTKLTDMQVYAVFEKEGEKQILTNKKQGLTLLDNSYSIQEI